MEPPKAVSFINPPHRQRSGTLFAPASPKKKQPDPKPLLTRANSLKVLIRDSRDSHSFGFRDWAQELAAKKTLQLEIRHLIFRRKASTDLPILELLAYLGDAPKVPELYKTYLAIEEEGETLIAAPKGAYSLVGGKKFLNAVKQVRLWLSSGSDREPPLEPLIEVVASYMESYLKKGEPAKPLPPPRKSSPWQLFSRPSAVQSIDEVPLSILHLTAHYCCLTTALPKDIGEYGRIKGRQVVDALPMNLGLICTIVDKLYTARQNEMKLAPIKQDTTYLSAIERWLVEVLQPDQWEKLTKEKGPVPNKVVGSGLTRSLMQLNKRWKRDELEKQATTQVMIWIHRQSPLQRLLVLDQHLEWDADLTLIATDPDKKKLLRGIAGSGANFKEMIVDGNTLKVSPSSTKPIEIATEISNLIIKHCWPHEKANLDVQAMERILQHPKQCSPLERCLRLIFLGLEIGSHAQHQNKFRAHCLALHEPTLTTEKDKDDLRSTTVLTVIPDHKAQTVTTSITREFVVYRRDDHKPLARYDRETYLVLTARGEFTRAGIRIKAFDWKPDVKPKERELITKSFMKLNPPPIETRKANCNN